MKRNKHGNSNKNKRQGFTYLILFASIMMLSVGLFLLIKPIWIRYNKDLVTQQLIHEFESNEQRNIWVDPNAWKSSDESIDRFILSDNDSNQFVQVDSSASAYGRGRDLDIHITSSTELRNTVKEEGSDHQEEMATDKNDLVSLIAVARLTINEIGVDLPVIEGLTAVNLRFGAALYGGAAGIGEIGVAAVFAHRSPDHGRDVNRLDELKEGSQFWIDQNGMRLYYEVEFNIVVEPVEIFDYMHADVTDHSELLIITCDPIPAWTHRMIVKARLVDSSNLNT